MVDGEVVRGWDERRHSAVGVSVANLGNHLSAGLPKSPEEAKAFVCFFSFFGWDFFSFKLCVGNQPSHAKRRVGPSSSPKMSMSDDKMQ